MSWKSVEMQVALPRTQDAGKLQDQLSKQNQHFQQSLSEQKLKEEKIQQQRVNEFEDVEHVKSDKERNQENSKDGTEDKEQEQNRKKDEQVKHPHLGVNIDYTS